jgi:hypothetical protein
MSSNYLPPANPSASSNLSSFINSQAGASPSAGDMAGNGDANINPNNQMDSITNPFEQMMNQFRDWSKMNNIDSSKAHDVLVAMTACLQDAVSKVNSGEPAQTETY